MSIVPFVFYKNYEKFLIKSYILIFENVPNMKYNMSLKGGKNERGKIRNERIRKI